MNDDENAKAGVSRESRSRGAIYGTFVADALAMPVHWYYNRSALKKDYGHVRDYLEPQNPHPDSILWRSTYQPVNSKGEILHDQAKYWGQRNIHYHQFLKAGENTLNVTLCRLVMESLIEEGGYDADEYVERYIAFMTTPGSHRDTYVEEYHRHFFTQYAKGVSPRKCGVREKHIGGLIGLVPIIVFYQENPGKARSAALKHLALTHLGPRMEMAALLFVDVLLQVLGGKGLKQVILAKIQRQETPLVGHPFLEWLQDPDEIVVGGRFSTACYVEDSVPSVLYLALKYHDDPEGGLIANTNLGGDNVHRGAVLGALLGAENGIEQLPERWTKGLRHPPPDLLPISQEDGPLYMP
ncbi:ADP-ribosylglycohydrolase family protein [Thermodesulfobacteriota bacterium]